MYPGNFVGPTIGGVLVESYGFVNMTTAFAIIYFVSFIINLFEITHRMVLSNGIDGEYDPLEINPKPITKKNCSWLEEIEYNVKIIFSVCRLKCLFEKIKCFWVILYPTQ